MMQRSADLDSDFYSLSISISSTTITERHFRLANGGLQALAEISGPPLENLNTNVVVYRGTLRIENVEEFIIISSGNLKMSADLVLLSSFIDETATTDVLFKVVPPG